MRILLAFATALLVSLSAYSQSDYGWFTGKASAFVGAGDRFGAGCGYMYNVSDRLACGMVLGVGRMAERSGVSVPMAGSVKLGLADRRKHHVQPVVHVSGGYSTGSRDFRGLYAEERIGLETTKIARIRYSFDIGCAHIHNSSNCYLMAVGLLF